MNVKSFLALGSNIGDSKGYLQTAIEQLRQVPGIASLTSSSLYRTPPWGKLDQPDFYNCVVEVTTSLTPHQLLAACQQIETQLHRQRNEVWGPRTLDIDIIWYDNQAICTPDLIIPHPYLYQRAFVLVPLAEIATDFQCACNRLASEDIQTIQQESW
ncbi:MAG: 2-amino-4-hydroxy-6-hydroxymethyldihydropteridine diphosphokinase [Culicoidibacterales bacterium]